MRLCRNWAILFVQSVLQLGFFKSCASSNSMKNCQHQGIYSDNYTATYQHNKRKNIILKHKKTHSQFDTIENEFYLKRYKN